MAALLYFEEKVHRKKLLRVDAIPLLFPRLLCQILEHLGYPVEPQHERRRICREIFTLDKWTSMTAYGGTDQGAPAGLEHPDEPEEPVDIPADTHPPAPTVAPIEPIPKVAPSAPQATPQTPPIIPPTSEPSPSTDPKDSYTHYRIITSQAQHTAILRQIQHHLGIILAPDHATPSPPEPSQAP
ncbi:hypothetical protein CK203_110712 [Vitis vinifera]|uniref:Uncharacterized protein n=1 Tax=Vitis vinifera TaxID=29760 RepID=A0A438CDZ3_VITVI|nr:hypothetical protein CK203_110712 [Vitis vinifera]